jgi:hypothetical protein
LIFVKFLSAAPAAGSSVDKRSARTQNNVIRGYRFSTTIKGCATDLAEIERTRRRFQPLQPGVGSVTVKIKRSVIQPTNLIFEVKCTGGHEVVVVLLHPSCSSFEVGQGKIANAAIVAVGDSWKNAFVVPQAEIPTVAKIPQRKFYWIQIEKVLIE